MKALDYTVALRKDSPSVVGGLDATGVVPVNRYPVPAAPMPLELTQQEFETLPATFEQLERRRKIYALQHNLLANVPGSDKGPEPVHLFTNGMYFRQLTMEAGFVVVSKRHAREHLCTISQGLVTVFTEDGATLIRAPYSFVSPAGSKRVLLVHERTVWSTVHRTLCTTPEEAERDITTDETGATP